MLHKWLITTRCASSLKLLKQRIGWKAALLITCRCIRILLETREWFWRLSRTPITWVVAAIIRPYAYSLMTWLIWTVVKASSVTSGGNAWMDWLSSSQHCKKSGMHLFWVCRTLNRIWRVCSAGISVHWLTQVQVIVAALTMLYALFTGNTEPVKGCCMGDGLLKTCACFHVSKLSSLFEPLGANARYNHVCRMGDSNCKRCADAH